MSPKKTSSKKAAPKKPTADASSARKAPAKRGASARGKSTTGATKKPTTAPKPSEMEGDVLEFIQAIDDYKRAEGRPFPTWSEILDIVKELGYERRV